MYQQADTGSVGGMLDGDQLQLFLSSPDNQDMLTVNIQGTEPGIYPVGTQYEAPQPGEAQLNFLNAEPPALILRKARFHWRHLTAKRAPVRLQPPGQISMASNSRLKGIFLD